MIIKQKFSVEGMSCAACSAAVERAVGRCDGVASVAVNLLSKSMLCEYDSDKVTDKDITAAVEKAGFVAEIYVARQDKQQPKKRPLILSVILLLVLMYLSMGHMLNLPQYHFAYANELIYPLLELIVAIPIVWINRRFFTGGFAALIRRSPNMDSLVAVGAGASLVYGIFALVMIARSLYYGDSAMVMHYSHSLYFESAAMILTLVSVGKYLEQRSKSRTGKAVEALIQLVPDTACVLRNGVETTVLSAQLQVGDLVLVRPGERIPIDGVVEQGAAAVDESALTGEPMPAEKSPGSRVISASICKNGRLTIRAEAVGDDTTLSKIIGLVEDAGATKPPVARLADRVAAVFVPVVMTISLLTLIAWLLLSHSVEQAFVAAVSVLVISCPCALGLATPVAITVAVGKAAGEGILLRSGEAIELLGRCNTAVLDKTGTLTRGEPSVTDIIPYECEKSELMNKAAALERYSEHPLSEAICRAADDTLGANAATVAAQDFEAIPGRGVAGTVNGVMCFGGNATLLREKGIDTSAIENKASELEQQGKTVMYFAENGRFLGLIAAADELRQTSAAAIEQLHTLGLKTVMLTGDSEKAARTAADKLSIDELYAGLLPQDKDEVIRRLQDDGRRVVMIGDGINDSPALSRADVGIAVGGGTDIAIQSAQVVLLRDDLLAAARAVGFSRRVMRNIRENLFWAFFYNIIGIPIAAGVLYPAFGLLLSPMLAAAAMSLSSLFVVSNALRLYKQ